MEVTLFVEKEKESLIANPDEWLAKVRELGLDKQAAIVEEDTKPNPFLKMDRGTHAMFEILCPRRTDIEKFSSEPIPYEALGMYGLAVHEGYFDKVQIWDNAKEPDPIMVGKIGDDFYLMARWGLDKVTFEQLRDRAKKIWVSKAILKCKEGIKDYQHKLDNIETLADTMLNGEYVGIYV